MPLFFVTLSYAQSNSSIQSASANTVGTSTSQQSAQSISTPSFSLVIGLEYSEKIAEDEKGAKESGTDLVISPAYKINHIFSSSITTVLSKSNNAAGETSVSDTQIGLGIKGFQIKESLVTLHSLSGVIPTSEKSKETDRLLGAFGISNGLRYKNDIAQFEYKLGFSKNVHEFNINANNSPNIEYRLSNTVEVQTNLSTKFSLVGVGVYRIGRTYGGKERTSFEVHGDLLYEVSGKMSLNLGTSNVGSALKMNGVDSNITAYNDDTSVIRAGVSITL